MRKQQINVGLLGLGTVGSGVYKIMDRNREIISERVGSRVEIKKVVVRDLAKKRPLVIPPGILSDDPEDILSDPDIDIVVEVIGGTDDSRRLIEAALKAGKYVVTANNDLMATAGADLFSLADKMNKGIYYEGGVGGGITLIRPVKHCLAANRILRLMGIINGTTNYILTRMTLDGMSFADALAEAQAKGFAEQDPSSDLDGKDAAYKLAILAGLAFQCRVNMEDIMIDGIRQVTAQDITYAGNLGYVIKLLAIGEDLGDGLALRVHPSLVPKTHPLVSVYNEFNALFLEGDAVGEIMFYGKGAGEMPTGSAVVSDIIDLARTINHEIENGFVESRFNPRPVLPPERIQSRFYLRLQAYDRPGVFAALATAFGQQQVSLDMIIQQGSKDSTAEIVLVTHLVNENRFFAALEQVRQIEAIKQVNTVLRVIS